MTETSGTENLVARTLDEIQELYLSDSIPWVIGFSGGKDSSTVVQLVYLMLLQLQPEKRHKTVHVIASDTLVESPVVEEYLEKTISSMRAGIERQGVPMVVEKVVPELNETFWVNVLGKGYPAPNRFFRWCTERLKIDPATRYIQQQIDEYGAVIILLGARKDESSTRSQVLENHQIKGSVLRRHATMPQASVYTPIADWTTEDVWQYLMAYPTPWDSLSGLNSTLRNLYRDAAGECPLVIDTTTPSCGQSRFGCWTCTVVNVDNSMKGFVESGLKEYEWMAPLLEFRNKLKQYRDDETKRERWRRTDPSRPRGWAVEMGELSRADSEEELDESNTLGPFKLEVRQELLEDLLSIQKQLQETTGRSITLIQEEELDLIRRYWTEDYRVGSMAMLDILERVYGPAARRQQLESERRLLEAVCNERGVDVLAVDRLLDLERGYVTKLRKRGILQAVDDLISELSAKEDAPGANSKPVA
ncbi:MAG: DNA phosphorothioation system sulfurtransferase DndC [Bacillota bacterium]